MITHLKSELNYAKQNMAKGCQFYSHLLISKLKHFKSIKKRKSYNKHKNVLNIRSYTFNFKKLIGTSSFSLYTMHFHNIFLINQPKHYLGKFISLMCCSYMF
jgi:hypothetical protein